ncbi:hypothetical protein TREMEDRAFT_62690 [Tremella mesenterica DSM 1558]|uniref:uncharacterized protein n=1 Tax=Tremella mesenterica (strain ATCC 24925 / CBS 8224 / DSM 1558 / NBRC 9311 / NRRL Y-6157 / RJB 2259-6 / UBC 559-6) TaxID=578456 RepID=UPI0003F49795|nr:uncharacterized protein TREMEDRAFT_62690 [Tremella mesenterica DSM 1558]EIW68976.1 hypothetical protein TREMEDRAFT_62690 [Tremella mesenterica DSM 1558]
MPTVLITGLNGFVATHTAIRFLQAGWDVRGTVRSTSKGDKTLALPALKKYSEESRIGYVVVKDLEGDFTQALEGVDGVAHCASPWNMNGKTWAEYRDPAVKGTINIIQQAAKFPNIKAVSVVSSFTAIGDCTVPYYTLAGRVFTEADWPPFTDEFAAAYDGPQAAGLWYCVSKQLAEAAAIKIHEELKPGFTLATLCPPTIFGPSYHLAPGENPTEADLTTSFFYAATVAGKDKTVPDTLYTSWVDVRDVAEALCVTISQSKGGRYALCSGSYDLDQVAELVLSLRPDLAHVVPQHKTKDTPLSKGTYTLDSTKATQELGIHFIPLEKMVEDSVTQFENIGAVVSA